MILTVFAGSLAIGDLLIRPSTYSVGLPPADFPAQTVSIATVNNGQIVGWLAAGKAEYGTVLLLHGLRGDRRQMLGRAKFLNHSGFDVLLIDLPGHGESSSRKITFGYQESTAVQAALTYLSISRPNSPIAIIGVSLGAAAIVLADNLQPTPVAIVLESMYPTIEEALDDRLKLKLGELGLLLKPFLLLQFPLRLGLQPNLLQPVKRIKSLKSPVMIISGTNDRHTTLAETLKIFAAAPASKTLWLVQNAGHQNLHAYSPSLYEQKVSSFLERYMPRR